jgi:hypothetical protein
MITKARATLGDAKIASQLTEMRGLVDLSGPMRESEFYPWMITDMNKFFEDQFNLLDDDVKQQWITAPVVEEKTASIPNSDLTYKKIDWRATIDEYPWFFNTKDRRKALKEYIKNYGDVAFTNPDDTTVPDYSPASKSHYSTIDAWSSTKTELRKASSECKK